MSRSTLAARIATASSRLLLVAATIGMMLAVGAASASVGSGGTSARLGSIPSAHGQLKKVIVLLRERHAVVAAGRTLAQTLRAQGAEHVTPGTTLPFVLASVSSAQERALKANSGVQAVFPDVAIPAPKSAIPAEPSPFLSFTPKAAATASPGPCGNATAPEQDPEALGVIKAPAALKAGFDGAGIKTAYIADSIDPTIPDFQRNAKYASPGSPAGSPVVTAVDFSGDPANTPGGVGEAFGDASSIAAQGNTVFDLNKFVNTAHPLNSPCDITVTGAAPGASVLGINVFSSLHATTTSNFIQAIQYAVSHDVNVLNESFGGSPFPDTALDALRIADDDAVAAGVTVVVSSGDSGVTSTIGSPATDPKLISVGASTTFRAYSQDTFGGINWPGWNGKFVNNNISSLSSGGFAQTGGGTVDLVAPGDLNWALCSTNTSVYPYCTNENRDATGLQLFGGTSESAPLTSAAAALVIEAYQKTHGGKSPSPALVKQILVSTATDIHAPAEQQGAGLLNVGGAVKLAESIHTKHRLGGLLISPNQINITQNPGATGTAKVRITNDGKHKTTVHLSTRTLTKEVSSQNGSFCLNPSNSLISCGGPTTNSFQIWSGAREVYQAETFTVPSTKKKSRLNFSANYPFTGQNSLLHFGLFDPSGTFAGYSLPQGIGDYGNVQVADPKPGKWTAVFFTLKDDPTAGNGTGGTIKWQADTWTYGSGGKIKPASLKLKPGQTKSATFKVKSPTTPGDAAQSILLHTKHSTVSVPVTVRTLVKTGATGGTFNGVLTGGNGRGNPAQTSTYVFNVPSGEKDLDVTAAFNDPNNEVIGFLEDPQGEAVASSSNVTFDSSFSNIINTKAVNVYVDNPQAGRWTFVLDWEPPLISGNEFDMLSMPFSGKVQFNQVNVSSNLPSGTTLMGGVAHSFNVTVTNTGASPQAFMLDPRASGTEAFPLNDLNGSDQHMTLPLDPGLTFPIYIVPTDTSEVETSLAGSAPVSYDIDPLTGDPDLSPALTAPGVVGSQSGNNASLDYTPASTQLAPRPWGLFPSESGPYGPSGAPAVTASATFSAVTQAFDPTVNPSTGDLWTANNGNTSTFNPVYLSPGQSASIPLTITPSASPGTSVSGTIKVDDVFQVNFGTGFLFGGGDELASLPYSYTVG